MNESVNSKENLNKFINKYPGKGIDKDIGLFEKFYDLFQFLYC